MEWNKIDNLHLFQKVHKIQSTFFHIPKIRNICPIKFYWLLKFTSLITISSFYFPGIIGFFLVTVIIVKCFQHKKSLNDGFLYAFWQFFLEKKRVVNVKKQKVALVSRTNWILNN